MDESWDSPNNIKLLDKLPAIYDLPAPEKVKPGYTYYQVFTGPDTLFPKPDHKPRLEQIKDGTSNTLLVVEAGTAVPWTKPEDLVYDPKGKELPKLGGIFGEGFLAAFCDGSVEFVRRSLDQHIVRALITPSGREPFDRSSLDMK